MFASTQIKPLITFTQLMQLISAYLLLGKDWGDLLRVWGSYA